jgi:hypothetical protein
VRLSTHVILRKSGLFKYLKCQTTEPQYQFIKSSSKLRKYRCFFLSVLFIGFITLFASTAVLEFVRWFWNFNISLWLILSFLTGGSFCAVLWATILLIYNLVAYIHEEERPRRICLYIVVAVFTYTLGFLTIYLVALIWVISYLYASYLLFFIPGGDHLLSYSV